MPPNDRAEAAEKVHGPKPPRAYSQYRHARNKQRILLETVLTRLPFQLLIDEMLSARLSSGRVVDNSYLGITSG
jgi:hypothetical protein